METKYYLHSPGNYEKLLKDFLLKRSDSVAFTRSEWKVPRFSWRKLFYFEVKGAKDDPKFLHTLESLQEDYLGHETNNMLAGYEQPGGRLFDHYFYRLSPRMKARLYSHPLWWFGDATDVFYGLENPTFYRTGTRRMIGGISSVDNYIRLTLTREEHSYFTDHGIRLEVMEDR